MEEENQDDQKDKVMTKPKPYKVSDGNGGHLWDKNKIKESVIAGLILTALITTLSTLANRLFNVNDLKVKMNTVVENQVRLESYSKRSLQMNESQNRQINSNTEIIYKKWFPGVPPPQICWPSDSEVK